MMLGNKVNFWELVVPNSGNEKLLFKRWQEELGKTGEAVPTP